MNSMSMGFPELMISFILIAVYAIPIAVTVWVVVTLRGLRAGQHAVQMKLDTIERLLQRP